MPSTNLHYFVSMSNPSTHYYEVVIEISNLNGWRSDSIKFYMPVWTPGSYVIREFARNVLDLEAFNPENGSKLFCEKDSKNSWTVKLNGAKSLLVKYRVYAFEYTVRTSYLDNFRGIINGASVFMAVEGREHEPFLLTLNVPGTLSQISTSLVPGTETSGSASRTFQVPDFDTLVDSPIELGNQRVHTFSVAGVEHVVSLSSAKRIDEEKLVSDIQRIVKATIPVFDHVPYDRYNFFVDFSLEGYGGLEHLNGCYCMVPYFRLEPEEEYHRLLSLFSHEFLHAWNVKRMKPKALGPFDYSKEAYTKSLWIAEGITSYYDDLLIRRAGIYSVGEYLDAFCDNLNEMISLPGRLWQSAEESSFDAWIRQYRPDGNSPNVSCSYYTQGAVIAWMIDMEIKKSSYGERSLDDVLRKIYRDTYLKDGRGYSDTEFEDACNEIAGNDLSEIFDARVRGRSNVEFDKYLAYTGLKITSKIERRDDQPAKGFLGAKIRSDGGRTLLTTVLFDSAAEKGGLANEDEIIAVDNLRIDSTKLAFYISTRRPYDRVKLLISRDGSIHELNLKVQERPVFEFRIEKKERSSDEEKALFRSWMQEDYEKVIEYPEYTPSPARKQIFDFI